MNEEEEVKETIVDQMQITTTYDDEAYHSQQESALKRGMIEPASQIDQHHPFNQAINDNFSPSNNNNNDFLSMQSVQVTNYQPLGRIEGSDTLMFHTYDSRDIMGHQSVMSGMQPFYPISSSEEDSQYNETHSRPAKSMSKPPLLSIRRSPTKTFSPLELKSKRRRHDQESLFPACRTYSHPPMREEDTNYQKYSVTSCKKQQAFLERQRDSEFKKRLKLDSMRIQQRLEDMTPYTLKPTLSPKNERIL